MVAVVVGSVPDHGFGLVFILLGEDDVAVDLGMFARLSKPCFHTGRSDLVCGCRWCGCVGGCWHAGPP